MLGVTAREVLPQDAETTAHARAERDRTIGHFVNPVADNLLFNDPDLTEQISRRILDGVSSETGIFARSNDQDGEGDPDGAAERSLDAVRKAVPTVLGGRTRQSVNDHVEEARRACENFLEGYPKATSVDCLHAAAAHLVHAISRHRGE
jgi:hypothetical protein